MRVQRRRFNDEKLPIDMKSDIQQNKDNPPEIDKDIQSDSIRNIKLLGVALDILLLTVLFLWTIKTVMPYAQGDLWLDESDYAGASHYGFQVNRWDTPDPKDPARLMRLRHFHAPFVPDLIELTTKFGVSDRVFRFPAMIAGALSVCIIYLCGLLLFTPRTEAELHLTFKARVVGDILPAKLVSLACALIVMWAPACVRAFTHMLPWAFIILWMLLMVYSLLLIYHSGRYAWVILTGAAVGMMFVTSEYFFPCILALGLIPVVLIGEEAIRRRTMIIDWRGLLSWRKAILWGAGAMGVYLMISWVFWPAGLMGDSFRMLMHYVRMAHDVWPVVIAGVHYQRAPKWAYAYWYWVDFKIFFLLYAAGLMTTLWIVLKGRANRSLLALFTFTGVVLFTAHRSHIIGPEYLAHALPLMSLLGGYFFVSLLRLYKPLGVVMIVLFCILGYVKLGKAEISGLGVRAREPRWSLAAKYIASHWKPGYSVLAPAYASAARWYLLHYAGIPAKSWQVQALPETPPNMDRDSLEHRRVLLHDILDGVYHYIAVGSEFSDDKSVDPTIRRILYNPKKPWRIVWKSPELPGKESRLVIYECPDGVSTKSPLPFPAGGISPTQLLNKLQSKEQHDR